jgi:hypothetical protein
LKKAAAMKSAKGLRVKKEIPTVFQALREAQPIFPAVPRFPGPRAGEPRFSKTGSRGPKFYGFLALMFFSAFNAAAQKELSKDRIIELLGKHSVIEEHNPVHAGGNSEIYHLFVTTLAARNAYSPERREELRMKAFTFLYANAGYGYEDTLDVVRISMRRKLIYMTMALLSPDEGRFYYFLNCAERSVDTISFYPEQLHRDYVLIGLLKILMLLDSKYDEGASLRKELNRLSQYAHTSGAQFPDGFLGEVSGFFDG